MRILIDADGCPVVAETVKIAKQNNIEVIIFCDTSHEITYENVQTITVSKGADSVDFALVNCVQKEDIVVTQDYGLSAMVLSRGGLPITQNGLLITDSNITMLLISRYENKKVRMSGGHIKGPKKRTEANNKDFITSLENLIKA